ncbi:MAG: hypothetical protein COT74_09325 [Bdellovibrionales bacterium CG10_big_fil_rev_8_21_14_0_10_45_34]|nr:MAG: hypothetical protein COT74_09325 [Bdellovibrionales bacterium CG10_big_fil_rev_8_21_14_0_10_45_34]
MRNWQFFKYGLVLSLIGVVLPQAKADFTPPAYFAKLSQAHQEPPEFCAMLLVLEYPSYPKPPVLVPPRALKNIYDSARGVLADSMRYFSRVANKIRGYPQNFEVVMATQEVFGMRLDALYETEVEWARLESLRNKIGQRMSSSDEKLKLYSDISERTANQEFRVNNIYENIHERVSRIKVQQKSEALKIEKGSGNWHWYRGRPELGVPSPAVVEMLLDERIAELLEYKVRWTLTPAAEVSYLDAEAEVEAQLKKEIEIFSALLKHLTLQSQKTFSVLDGERRRGAATQPSKPTPESEVKESWQKTYLRYESGAAIANASKWLAQVQLAIIEARRKRRLEAFADAEMNLNPVYLDLKKDIDLFYKPIRELYGPFSGAPVYIYYQLGVEAYTAPIILGSPTL